MTAKSPRKIILLALTHLAMLATGFAAGIYVLPILTEQAGASTGQVQAVARQAAFSGAFRKDLAGSDALHWASGRLHVSARAIAFEGSVAPGPDYRIYLVPEFVDTEAAFLGIKVGKGPPEQPQREVREMRLAVHPTQRQMPATI